MTRSRSAGYAAIACWMRSDPGPAFPVSTSDVSTSRPSCAARREGVDGIGHVLSRIRAVDAEHVWPLRDPVPAANSRDGVRIAALIEERGCAARGTTWMRSAGATPFSHSSSADERRGRRDDVSPRPTLRRAAHAGAAIGGAVHGGKPHIGEIVKRQEPLRRTPARPSRQRHRGRMKDVDCRLPHRHGRVQTPVERMPRTVAPRTAARCCRRGVGRCGARRWRRGARRTAPTSPRRDNGTCRSDSWPARNARQP